jgi:hypothetical protein
MVPRKNGAMEITTGKPTISKLMKVRYIIIN